MKRTKIEPTVGRMVYVQSHLWSGVRAAVVTGLSTGSGPHPLVHTTVFGTQGDTFHTSGFHSIPIVDPPDDDEVRDADWAAKTLGSDTWAEWMPFQMGQAARTEQIAKAAGMSVEASQPQATKPGKPKA